MLVPCCPINSHLGVFNTSQAYQGTIANIYVPSIIVLGRGCYRCCIVLWQFHWYHRPFAELGDTIWLECYCGCVSDLKFFTNWSGWRKLIDWSSNSQGRGIVLGNEEWGLDGVRNNVSSSRMVDKDKTQWDLMGWHRGWSAFCCMS